MAVAAATTTIICKGQFGLARLGREVGGGVEASCQVYRMRVAVAFPPDSEFVVLQRSETGIQGAGGSEAASMPVTKLRKLGECETPEPYQFNSGPWETTDFSHYHNSNDKITVMLLPLLLLLFLLLLLLLLLVLVLVC